MLGVESLEEEDGASCTAKQRIEAICKKATALAAVHDVAKAAREIQQACKLCSLEGGCWQQITAAAQLLSFGWQAQHWANLIAKAEAPNPLSSRDGKLLRMVPLGGRLDLAEMARNLESVLPFRLKQESIPLLLQAWSTGKPQGRATLALMRSYAYLQGCRWDQALKDAKFAAAYGPQANGSSCWPRALAAISAAIEGKQSDNIQAALFMQRALELDPSHDLYAADLERLLRRIPEQHADTLQAGGSEALGALLAQERGEALPEFRRLRPKYYYYYKWMRGRVAQHCGELPAPVMDKVLHIDASELNMLLTYPKGIQRQAAHLLDMYNTEGAAAFEAYRLPLLTWRESEALKAEHAQPVLDAPKGTPTRALQGLDSIEEEDDDDLDALEPIDDL